MQTNNKTTSISKNKYLARFLSENGVFSTENNNIKCIPCNTSFIYNSQKGYSNVKTHAKTLKHRKNTKIYIDHKNVVNNDIFSSERADELLATALIQNSIPFNVIDSKSFKDFFAYTGYCPKSAKYFSEKVVKDMASKRKNELYIYFRGKEIAIRFDESLDAMCRKILIVQVNLLKSDHYTKPVTILCKQIEKTDAETVKKELLALLGLFLITPDEKLKLRAIISDGAAYCRKAAREIQEVYTNARYIVCICHNLHNLATSCISNLPNLEKVIAFLGLKLKFSSKNRDKWSNMTGLPQIPSFSKTRWGEWIVCANFVAKNWYYVQNFIDLLNFEIPEQKQCIFNNIAIKNELELVQHYDILPQTIRYLESQGLSLNNQLSAYEGVYDKLELHNDKNRYNEILAKNNDFYDLLNNFKKKLKNQHKVLNYLECSNASVERAFSKYNKLFSPQRRNLTVSNIQNFLIIDEMKINLY